MDNHFPRQLFLACVVVSLANPAGANPTGTNYNYFFDTTVVDPNGNTAIESHFSGGNPLTFDGVYEFDGGGVFGGTGMFNPAAGHWITEMVMPDPNDPGVDVVTIWVLGDDDGDPNTFPAPGSFGPLFGNDLDPNGLVVSWGLEQLYWADADPNSGEFALVESFDFRLTFDGGAGDPGVPLIPSDFFAVGDGTVADPLLIFVQFNPADFAGVPTDFHAEFRIRHIPEPVTRGLALAGLLSIGAAVWRRRLHS